MYDFADMESKPTDFFIQKDKLQYVRCGNEKNY